MFPVRRRPRFETEIARREVKLLVIRRIVRDVHLAILPEELAVGVDDRRGVVINAGGAFLEKRGDDDDAAVRARVCLTRRSIGPGISSASAKLAWSSDWQKYCERKSSGRQTICAPCFAASRMRAIALARFASGSGPHCICTSAILRSCLHRASDYLHRISRNDLDALDTATRLVGLLLSPPVAHRSTWRVADLVEHVVAFDQFPEGCVLMIEMVDAPRQMKNWLPAESGSAERAIERTPRSCGRSLNSALIL